MTLNDLRGHSPVAGLFKCNTSNICAAFYTISTDGSSALAELLVVSIIIAVVFMAIMTVDSAIVTLLQSHFTIVL